MPTFGWFPPTRADPEGAAEEMTDMASDGERKEGAGSRGGGRGGLTVQEAGRKGGETVLRERGPEFFAEIGKKGGQKVRDLINAGKRSMK